MHTPRYRSFPLLATALTVTALMAGCAQQLPAGYYNPPRASSVTDAEAQAQGAGYLPLVQPPSQLQIGLNSPAPAKPSNTSIAQAAIDGQGAVVNTNPTTAEAGETPLSAVAQALIPQAKTFMGTLPCLTPSSQCAAQKLVLTLAPNGRWRSRSAAIDSTGTMRDPSVTQGCWNAVAERPTQVWLNDAAGDQVADFVVSSNNVLRVKSALGVTPNLNYSLTRQPDLDPIDELNTQPAPTCSP